MKALRLVSLWVCGLALFSSAAGEERVVIERDVAAAMRDGVLLRADVHRPDGGGPYPVLVWRFSRLMGETMLDRRGCSRVALSTPLVMASRTLAPSRLRAVPMVM